MREVCIWVEHIGLGQFRKKFAHHAIDGRVLAALTDEHLKADLQITGLGHRFKLLEEIAALAGRAPDGRGAGPGPRTPRERAEAKAGGALGRLSEEEYRTRIVKELNRASARASRCRAIADTAARQAALAEEEVHKLQKQLEKVERAIKRLHSRQRLDAGGPQVWRATGDFTSTLTGSQLKAGGTLAEETFKPHLSRKSLEIVEEMYSGGGFLSRYESDIKQRAAKSKAKEREQREKDAGLADHERVREQDSKDVDFLQELLYEKCGFDLPVEQTKVQTRQGHPGHVSRVSIDVLSQAVETYQDELGISAKEWRRIGNTSAGVKKQRKIAALCKARRFLDRLSSSEKQRLAKKKETAAWAQQFDPAHAAKREREAAQRREAVAFYGSLGWSGPAEIAEQLHHLVAAAHAVRARLEGAEDAEGAEAAAGAPPPTGAAFDREFDKKLTAHFPAWSRERERHFLKAAHTLGRVRNDKYWRRILAIPLSAKDAQGMPKKALALHAEMKTQEFIDFTVKDLNDRESKAKAAYQEEPAAAPPSRPKTPRTPRREAGGKGGASTPRRR